MAEGRQSGPGAAAEAFGVDMSASKGMIVYEVIEKPEWCPCRCSLPKI